MEPDKEKIMAYVDGELNPEESAQVKEAIEGSKIATAQMEVFKRSRDLLIQEYGSIRGEAVPEALLRTVIDAPEGDGARQAGPDASPGESVVRLERKKGFGRLVSNWPAQSIAASLVMGAFLGSSIFGVLLNSDQNQGVNGQYSSRGIDQNQQKLAVALAREMAENPNKESYEIQFEGELRLSTSGSGVSKDGSGSPDIEGNSMSTVSKVVLMESRYRFINSSGESCRLMEISVDSDLELAQKYVVTCRDSDNEWYISK